jgi:VWFA-related protein
VYNLRMSYAGLLTILLGTVVGAGAQKVQNGTIRVNTRLVEVNVVARDKSGPVADLRKEDFTILDGGKPRPVDLFAVSGAGSRKQGSLGPMPPRVASNIRNADGEIPESATVILFDMMNASNDGATKNLTDGDDQNEAVRQLVGYLRTMREGDRVALFVLGYQLHAIQDFTGDPDVLARAAQRLAELDRAGIEVTTRAQLAVLLEPPPISNPDGSVTYVGAPGFANAMVTVSAINRAVATADAFEAIALHMSGLPGRKNVVWMSAGFPFKPVVPERRLGVQAQAPVETPDDFSGQLNRASKALNDANVAVYPVDYQGLNGSYPEVIMMRLAAATGGSVAYRTNDLTGAVATAVADADASYTLGFYPTDDRSDGKLRDLTVKVNRKDVELRYRPGYYSSSKAIPEKQRQGIVSRLLAGNVNSSQIGLVAMEEPDPATPGSHKVTISIDAANLHLVQKGDRRTGQLSLTMRLESSKSKNAQVGAIPLNFTEEQFQNALKRGFVIRQTIHAEPNDQLRIVVQDEATGLTGALRLPLP